MEANSLSRLLASTDSTIQERSSLEEIVQETESIISLRAEGRNDR